MASIRPLLSLFVLAVLAAPGLADAPTADEVRGAIGRSLPFLEKEGIAWMRGRQCMSCHQVPSMLWTLNEARRHGFAVNADRLAASNEWAVANVLQRGTFFKLTDKSYADLKKAEIAEADLSKLQPLKNKAFSLEPDFRQEVSKLLPGEEAGKHHEQVVKAASIPGTGNGGGGINNQYVALLLANAYAGTKAGAEAQKDLVERLVKTQKKDGSWEPGTQFRDQKRPLAETVEATTLWTVLVLAGMKDLPEEAVQAGMRAREFLKNAKPGASIESLLLHAMLARVDGDTKRSQGLVEELLRLQQDDGGWGWLREGAPSDPFTTGEVLYGLSTLGRGRDDANVQKAVKYLLANQKPDGSWFVAKKTISTKVKENPKDGDAVYTYWATGWAVIGLLQTLPE
jgi:squalene-hopene/tetraprenyl-beta-curcumene cyclase